MVIPKLHFFQVEGEFFLGDAMVFDQPFLGVAPESLDAVDVNFPGGESFFMVDFEMPIPTEHQRVITPIFVCVHDGSPSHRFDCERKQSLGRDIFDSLNLNHAIPLKYAKYGHFSRRTPSSFAFSLTSEIRFIELDFTAEKVMIRRVGHQRQSNDCNGLKHGGITKPDLLCDLPGTKIKLEEFDHPQPVPVGDI